jgi:hypothetical protein
MTKINHNILNKNTVLAGLRVVSKQDFYSYIGNFRMTYELTFLNIDGESAMEYSDKVTSKRGVVILSKPNQYYLTPKRQKK